MMIYDFQVVTEKKNMVIYRLAPINNPSPGPLARRPEVPALGVYRGGKSLLLNRLMQRRAPYSNSFGVGHGQQTFTRPAGGLGLKDLNTYIEHIII